MRPSLGRLSTFESLWEAWCDSIRVLIRVLQPPAAIGSPTNQEFRRCRSSARGSKAPR